MAAHRVAAPLEVEAAGGGPAPLVLEVGASATLRARCQDGLTLGTLVWTLEQGQGAALLEADEGAATLRLEALAAGEVGLRCILLRPGGDLLSGVHALSLLPGP